MGCKRLSSWVGLQVSHADQNQPWKFLEHDASTSDFKEPRPSQAQTTRFSSFIRQQVHQSANNMSSGVEDEWTYSHRSFHLAQVKAYAHHPSFTFSEGLSNVSRYFDSFFLSRENRTSALLRHNCWTRVIRGWEYSPREVNARLIVKAPNFASCEKLCNNFSIRLANMKTRPIQKKLNEMRKCLDLQTRLYMTLQLFSLARMLQSLLILQGNVYSFHEVQS
jgi:hypothetical protein